MLQSSITEEHRQAYNSLVEKPAATLSKLDLSKLELMKASFKDATDDDGGGCQGDAVKHSTTLPRNLIRTTLANRRTGGGSLGRAKDAEFTMPSHPAPRPEVTDANPLRILRNKNFPIVRPRLKHLTTFQGENPTPPEGTDDMCESPSYLVNTEYTYPEKEQTDASLNPIPLPPRDRNKIITTNTKRHVRKHALIIPASGLQRTLNKVSQDLAARGGEIKVNNDSNYNTNSLIKRSMQVSKLQEIDQTDAVTAKRLQRTSNGPDVVDGFSCFEIQKDTYDKYCSTFEGAVGNDSELRNLDLERQKSQRSDLPPPRMAPKAIPESSESYTTSDEEQMIMGESQLLQEASNSVSCEDLLEFSEKKPKGRERGAESDEVRIMIKVLGKKIPPEMCLETLELVDWDVHKAIKIMKLSNMCNVSALGLCMDVLQENEWDLPRAALKLSARK
uniref:Tyrosine-protein kinase pr2 n=1 Tax=Lutzomyia longipalpis TaxID=7200 RepID=A0A1B0GJE2_LUTLO